MEKTQVSHWVKVVIGLAFMLLFPMLQPFGAITEVGMHVLGAFIGMIFLWTAVDSIWPSLLGLVLIGLSGFLPDLEGYAAIKAVFLNAFGSDTVIAVMLCMFLFSAVNYVGCTKYIVRFFMSRKIIEGRPYVFAFILFFCASIISGLTQPFASLLILWPIAVSVCEQCGYKKGDTFFTVLMCGIYLGTTMGQPMLPFKGASYVVVSAYEKNFEATVNFTSFIAFNIVMSALMLIAYLLFVKFVLRPDTDGFKKLTIADVMKEDLPKMNRQQILVLVSMVAFIVMMLAPTFLSKDLAIIKLFSSLGVIGALSVCIIILMILTYKGKSVMDFKGIGKNYNWSTYFLVAAALYACNALTNEVTGIKPFLVDLLTPVLGGHSDFVFVIIILAMALILTNIGNNAGMATVVLPIVAAFVDQYPGVNPTALCMSVTMIVFVAVLTPAASPFAAMLFGRRDLVEVGDAEKLFIPTIIIAIVLYSLIGYNFASLIF